MNYYIRCTRLLKQTEPLESYIVVNTFAYIHRLKLCIVVRAIISVSFINLRNQNI